MTVKIMSNMLKMFSSHHTRIKLIMNHNLNSNNAINAMTTCGLS
jgi:hypothetical protein